MVFPVIPANPGSVSGTGAGIQEKQTLLDPGFRRGGGFDDFSGDRHNFFLKSGEHQMLCSLLYAHR
jgi:hypothetical protein